MMGIGGRGRRGAFALAMAAALGFGAAQAVAAPRTADVGRACSRTQCRQDCIARGYDNGYCDIGVCMCMIQ